MAFKTIEPSNINILVNEFYNKILEDKTQVTDVFVSMLGDDLQNEKWQEHLEILTRFWTKQTMNEPVYDGNPLMAHFHLPLNNEMFTIWLDTFIETANRLYEPQLAKIFTDKALIIC
jgi:hemoglobin